MAEEGSDGLEVMVLRGYLHGDPVTKIMGLEHRIANQLTESPKGLDGGRDSGVR